MIRALFLACAILAAGPQLPPAGRELQAAPQTPDGPEKTQAPSPDTALVLDADFSSLRSKESAPEGANAAERALYTVRKQLTGRDFYDPPNYMFFRQAVRSLGLIPAILATLDRLTRDSRIGTVREYIDPDDPFIHEGPQAYKEACK